MIEGVDYFVRLVRFPNRSTPGQIWLNADGTYDIYIDERLTNEQRVEALTHELRHLAADRFYSLLDIKSVEREADENISPKALARRKTRVRCLRCGKRGNLSPAGLCEECVTDVEIEKRRADLRQVDECADMIRALQPTVEKALKHVPFYVNRSREEITEQHKACQDALSALTVIREHPRFYEAVCELASLNNNEILCQRFKSIYFTRDIATSFDLLVKRLKYVEDRTQ